MKATLYSVNTNEIFIEDGPMGRYSIACAPKGGISHIDIEDRVQAVYTGVMGAEGAQYQAVRIGGEEIATGMGERLKALGVFLPANFREPAELEIEQARTALKEFYEQQFQKAQDTWSRTGVRQAIPQVAREAAEALNQSPEWLMVRADEWKECPECAERIKAAAKKCKHCQTTLVAAAPAPAFSVKAAAK